MSSAILSVDVFEIVIFEAFIQLTFSIEDYLLAVLLRFFRGHARVSRLALNYVKAVSLV